MKRLFLIFAMLFLLTGCAKEELPIVTEDVLPAPVKTETAETPVEEIPIEIVAPEGPAVENSGEAVAYTCTNLEGLVEDTVGYTFEIPTFDVTGATAIGTYYEELAQHLESYTKETVYTEAASRACIVSVYGYVTEAVLQDDVLTVTYVYTCDFSDAEEAVENVRTDTFSATTGEKLAN